MNLGSNIHNAFAVVYETFKSIEKLMIKCRAELDTSKYYMPVEKFLRYSSDTSWEGWVYWSFILLFQRKKDGEIMEHNGWINGPLYAVEINVDAKTCKEPQLMISKMDFGDISGWSRGCSPANHTIFYNAIHGVPPYEKKDNGKYSFIEPGSAYKEKIADTFWGFQNLIRSDMNLIEVTQENYKDKIFGTMEELSRLDYKREKYGL